MSSSIDAGVVTEFTLQFSIDHDGRADYLRTFTTIGIPFVITAALALVFLARGLQFHVNRVARYVWYMWQAHAMEVSRGVAHAPALSGSSNGSRAASTL